MLIVQFYCFSFLWITRLLCRFMMESCVLSIFSVLDGEIQSVVFFSQVISLDLLPLINHLKGENRKLWNKKWKQRNNHLRDHESWISACLCEFWQRNLHKRLILMGSQMDTGLTSLISSFFNNAAAHKMTRPCKTCFLDPFLCGTRLTRL